MFDIDLFSCQFIGDHTGTDGTEQLIVFSCLHGNGDFDFTDLGSQFFGIGKSLGTAFRDLGLAGFDQAEHSGSNLGSESLGDQVVAGITRSNTDLFAGETELFPGSITTKPPISSFSRHFITSRKVVFSPTSDSRLQLPVAGIFL